MPLVDILEPVAHQRLVEQVPGKLFHVHLARLNIAWVDDIGEIHVTHGLLDKISQPTDAVSFDVRVVEHVTGFLGSKLLKLLTHGAVVPDDITHLVGEVTLHPVDLGLQLLEVVDALNRL